MIGGYMFKKFVSYYKPHRKLFVTDMICAFVVALCNMFYPYITKNIINNYVPDKNLQLMLIWLGVLLAIYIIKMFLNYFIQYWGHIVGVRIQGDMRAEFFRHIQKLPFSYFDETKTGTIMSRIINDLFEIAELAHHGPEDLFISVVSIIAAFVLMATINLPLTLIVFAVLPFMLLFAVKARKNMKVSFARSRERMAEINAAVESSVSGIRVSKAYTAAERETEKFDANNENFKEARGKAYKSMGIFFSGMGFFNDLMYFVVLLACGMFFYYDKIDAGEFAAFLLYITMLLNPVRTLVNIFEQIQDGMTGFTRFTQIMQLPPEADPDNPVEIDTLKGDIVFDDVSFNYKHDVENKSDREDRGVLNHLSLVFKEGKTTALVGPSGGGKTTICHLIPRFYETDSGSITIGGIDITRLKREDLRRNIGIVAQDVFLFGGTVKENIAYGNLNASDEEIIEAAKKANIDEFVSSLPNGYDTEVGERGVKLSGGQKQRISIARAFLKNPPILILDEATSALDNFTEMQIQEALEKLSKGRTTIVVAHRLSTVKNADEIIVVTKNGVEEQGTHEQLIQKGGIYRGLYEYQFRAN